MKPEAKNGRPRVAATIGVFDGVHLGHRALMDKVVERAKRLGVKSACITFSPHPEDVLRPQAEIAHLAPLEDRLELIRRSGMSEVLVIEFTPSLSRMSPEDFIDLLLSHFRLVELWIGSDFALGRDRAGGPERLAFIGTKRGFGVHQFPPVSIEGMVVSSTLIRLMLAEGRVEEAAKLLGRSYRLRGRVVAGDGRGRLLGFPTANLSLEERLCLPGNGVYAVRCGLAAAQHTGVVNIGLRPTFDSGRRLVEVHLLDFQGDLYGQELAVDFVARLRDEVRFESVDALVAQIRNDVTRSRQILSGRADDHL